MDERRRRRARRLLLAASMTGGAAGILIACSSDSSGPSSPEGPHGVVAQEAGYEDTGFAGFMDTGVPEPKGDAASDAPQGCDGCGLVADDASYDAGDDGG